MTWIKICGTTNLEDALAAVEAGADALGFVFAESQRKITPEAAREIVEHLPQNVEKIGVFVGESAEQAEAIAEQVGLTAVQLHRHDGIRSNSQHGVIPVLHMTDLEELDVNGGSLRFPDGVKTILLDSGNAKTGGGTGQCFDWQRASGLLRNAKLAARFRIVIAGGLAPENVGEAIETFHPYGVDVVSGVEREKGKKDPDKLRAFIAAVRAADARVQKASKAKTCQ